MRDIIVTIIIVLFFVILGLIGTDDLKNEISTSKQTEEIKAAMQQRVISERLEAEAYRQIEQE